MNAYYFRCKHKESAPTSAIIRLTSQVQSLQDQTMISDVEQDHQRSHLQQQNVPTTQQDFIKFVPPVIQIYDQHLALINILA